MATLAMDESSTFMKVASDRASVPRASWAPLSGACRAGMAGGAEGGAAGGTVGPPGCADSGTAGGEEVIGSPRRFWEGGGAGSGERRVGKEGRSRWAAYHLKKKMNRMKMRQVEYS